MALENIAKREFVALDISRKNYLSWVFNAKIHLEAKNLRETIKENNNSSLYANNLGDTIKKNNSAFL